MSDTNANTAKPRKPRATKKVAESAPISNVAIEEVDNNSVTEEGQKVITGPKKARPARVSNMNTKEDSQIISRAAEPRPKIKSESKKDEEGKMAIWSEKNIRWGTFGTLSKGYNIVTKEAAEKWLTRDGIRKASPEEVAAHYGKN